MYATRSHSHGSLADENKQADKGEAAAKKTRARSTAAGGRNRKALGDIGNVVAEAAAKNRAKAAPAAAKATIPPLPPAAAKRQLRTQEPTKGESRELEPQKHQATEDKPALPLDSDVPVAYNTRARAQKARRSGTLTALLTAQSEAIRVREEPVENIDEADAFNPLAVTDYVEDIYSFYRNTEVQSFSKNDYIATQSDINDKMRAILIDWLIEVHHKFQLMPETLFLTVNLIDRYLACKVVSRKCLQLVGVTAMLLAAKYEEIWAPAVQDFILISDEAYTREQILHMEKTMLNTLQFNLTVPTPYVFLVRFLKAAKSNTQLEHLSFYLVELCLVDYEMVKFPPSMLAAAAVYVAQRTLERAPYWSRLLQHHSCYTEEQLRECVRLVADNQKKASSSNLTVVYRKYASSKLHKVSLLSSRTVL